MINKIISSFIFLFVFLFCAPLQAKTIVYDINDLKNELDENSNIDVVFDASNVSNVEGNLTITKNQTVDFENISSWTNPEPDTSNINRIIRSEGNTSFNNTHFNNNKLWIGKDGNTGGGVIRNSGVISEISNSSFNNNDIKLDTFSEVQGGLWGGIIMNIDGGRIKVIKDSSFMNNTAQALKNAPHGTAIVNLYSRIDLIDNVIFENNVMESSLTDDYSGSGIHGSVLENNDSATIGTIINSKFINNKGIKKITSGSRAGHASGGAINSYNLIEKIEKSLFDNNAVIAYDPTAKVMGGAIKITYYNSNNVGRINEIKDVDFINNYAEHTFGEAYGGAIATNSSTLIKNMEDVSFKENYAQGDGSVDGNGGAFGGGIYNTGVIEKIKGEFNGNKALSQNAKAQGGAVYNIGTITFNDTDFVGNNVSGKQDATNGGAIWNSGIIEFEGNNYFVGNYRVVNGTKYNNDIYNEGTINVSDNALLDILGGITGNDGVINLNKNSTLNINSSEILGNGIIMSDNAKLVLEINGLNSANSEQSGGRVLGDVVLNGQNVLEINTVLDWAEIEGEGDYIFADNVDTTSGELDLTFKANGLYNIIANIENNKIAFDVHKKNDEEIAKDFGLRLDEVQQISEILNTNSNNPIFEDIRKGLSLAVQNMDKNVDDILYGISDKPEVGVNVLKYQGIMLGNIVSHRVFVRKNNAYRGIASGDKHNVKENLWVSTTYQTAENDGNLNYDVKSKAFVAGFDTNINPNLVVGMGYGYINSDVNSDIRNIEMDTHSLFTYGKYVNNKWFFDWFGIYGFSDNLQNKYLLGNKIASNYDSELFGLHLTNGLNINKCVNYCDVIFRPSVGMRYYHINQEKYIDNAGIEHASIDNDILTAVLGFELLNSTQFNGYNISQRGYINATYDIYNKGEDMLINLPNGGSYYVLQENDEDFGIEIGYGAEVDLSKAAKVGLNYELGLKKNYISHGAFADLKYEF